MNRREIIKSTLKLGALAAAGPVLTGFNGLEFFVNESRRAVLKERTGNPLRFPPIFTNGGTMTLAQTDLQVFPNMAQTQVIAVNNSYPGPTVRIQRGQTFTANFVNNLTEPATAHWHGLEVPAPMDGHPANAIPPQGSFTYTFPAYARGGTYFYHSHAHMTTGKHVYKGFAGFFIVIDPNEAYLGLPSGDFDVPLCIQDRRNADVPQFVYNVGMPELMEGYLGDIALVNGTPDPYFEVSRTLYRFRLLNGSNGRVYKIAFSDNTPFHIIATDGGLKDQAVQAASFFLSPGERVDILKDFTPYSLNQSVTLKSLAYSYPSNGTYLQGSEMDLLRFDVTGNNSSGGVVPANMPPITYYNPAEAVTVRGFILTMNQGTMNIHKINGLTFDINRMDWQTRLLSLEEWRILNATNMFHPMHIHGVQFQLYSRNGNTNLPPNDKGWKDTILLNAYETVRTLVKFTAYKGVYLFHCHNLEHEDDGMMLNFEIIDPIGIKKIGNEFPEKFELYQNYPNPFNSNSKIKYQIAKAEKVKLAIYDALGSERAVLVDAIQGIGVYEAEWDATKFPSGVYYCKLAAGSFVKTIKMVLVK